jgi:hypothetical protein
MSGTSEAKGTYKITNDYKITPLHRTATSLCSASSAADSAMCQSRVLGFAPQLRVPTLELFSSPDCENG